MASIAGGFPEIDKFLQAVSSQEQSDQGASTPVTAKVLVNLCRNVRRDLDYASLLHEDVADRLRSCSRYHTVWIQDVRLDACQALSDFNSYLKHKMPVSMSSGAPLKIKKVIRNNKKMASLQRELNAAHVSLVSVIGFMQMLEHRSGRSLLDSSQTLERLQAESPAVEH